MNKHSSTQRKLAYFGLSLCFFPAAIGLPIYGLMCFMHSTPLWVPLGLGLSFGFHIALFGGFIIHGLYTDFHIENVHPTSTLDYNTTDASSAIIATVVCVCI